MCFGLFNQNCQCFRFADCICLLKFFNKTPNDLFKKLEDYGYSLYLLADKLIPISSKDVFPFGVVDLFALKGAQIDVVMDKIGDPLDAAKIPELLEQTNLRGNEDIKNWVSWYKENYVNK